MTPTDLGQRVATVFKERASDLTTAWARGLSPDLRAKLRPYPDPQDPQVVRGIATCLPGPETAMHCAVSLFERARQWGEVAESRSVAAEELLDAYSELDALLWKTAASEIERSDIAPAPGAVLACMRRLHEAMAVAVRAATTAYLDIYRERMEADTDRLRSFNRIVSHELKGPVSVISGAAEVLAEEGMVPGPESRVHFQKMIQNSTDRLTKLLDDILALTTAEHELAEVPPLEVEEVFEEVRDALRADAARQDVRIEAEGPLPRVSVDRATLELALTNLIGNAIRYADPDEPERWVRLRAEPGEDDQYVLAVQDNGIGIPTDAQPQAFERFYRAERDREVAGTGLGLAIVEEVVERWGGRVWFDSQEGVGTTFYLTVPAADTDLV